MLSMPLVLAFYRRPLWCQRRAGVTLGWGIIRHACGRGGVIVCARCDACRATHSGNVRRDEAFVTVIALRCTVAKARRSNYRGRHGRAVTMLTTGPSLVRFVNSSADGPVTGFVKPAAAEPEVSWSLGAAVRANAQPKSTMCLLCRFGRRIAPNGKVLISHCFSYWCREGKSNPHDVTTGGF